MKSRKDIDRLLAKVAQEAKEEETLYLDYAHYVLKYATDLLVALGYSIAVRQLDDDDVGSLTVVGLVHATTPYDANRTHKTAHDLGHTCSTLKLISGSTLGTDS